ncbi:MAG: DUF359 domain-containing protein, partial [Microgenomates group bacterium]
GGQPVMIITVGDIISMSLESIGFLPDVKIVDFRTRRQRLKDFRGLLKTDFHRYLRQSIIVNPASTLSPRISQIFPKAIYNRLKTGRRQMIVIKGEEDLTALVAILLAPLYSVVVYGQMDLGVVVVEVTEERKKEVVKILAKFIVNTD